MRAARRTAADDSRAARIERHAGRDGQTIRSISTAQLLSLTFYDPHKLEKGWCVLASASAWSLRSKAASAAATALIAFRTSSEGMVADTASTTAMVASVAGEGMRTALTAAIEARVVADGMLAATVGRTGPATAVSKARQARRTFRVAARGKTRDLLFGRRRRGPEERDGELQVLDPGADRAAGDNWVGSELKTNKSHLEPRLKKGGEQDRQKGTNHTNLLAGGEWRCPIPFPSRPRGWRPIRGTRFKHGGPAS